MSVPVIFWLLLTGRTQAAFLIFVCAGISDAGLQLQDQRVSTRRTEVKLLINVS